MAFNLQTFKTRALTAIVFAAIMLCGLFINHWTFLCLFTIIHFGCWLEYQKMVGLIDKGYQQINAFHKYGVMVAGYSFMLWMTNNAYTIDNFSLHAIGWWLLLICAIMLPVTEVLFSKKIELKNIGHSLFGLIYISLSWGLMIDLRNNGMMFKGTSLFTDFGMVTPVLLIVSIWINDTMAYIVGSFIGKTPLSPISPKKTWEGTIGGAILAIAVVTLLGYYLLNANWIRCLIIATIAAIFGTLGDLLESKIKRLAGVKDSGNFMPGHGGFLDRFDSLLVATPLVWLCLYLFF